MFGAYIPGEGHFQLSCEAFRSSIIKYYSTTFNYSRNFSCLLLIAKMSTRCNAEYFHFKFCVLCCHFYSCYLRLFTHKSSYKLECYACKHSPEILPARSTFLQRYSEKSLPSTCTNNENYLFNVNIFIYFNS